MGAALMEQVKSTDHKGVQRYQHRIYTTSRQDNPADNGYLT